MNHEWQKWMSDPERDRILFDDFIQQGYELAHNVVLHAKQFIDEPVEIKKDKFFSSWDVFFDHYASIPKSIFVDAVNAGSADKTLGKNMWTQRNIWVALVNDAVHVAKGFIAAGEPVGLPGESFRDEILEALAVFDRSYLLAMDASLIAASGKSVDAWIADRAASLQQTPTYWVEQWKDKQWTGGKVFAGLDIKAVLAELSGLSDQVLLSPVAGGVSESVEKVVEGVKKYWVPLAVGLVSLAILKG